MSSSNPLSEDVQTCPACQAQAVGKYCSSCGASLAGAVCGACEAPLTPGARFCHRCGTAAGTDAPVDRQGFSSALPWAVAAIALVALVALIAGQHFGRQPITAAPASFDAATVPAGSPPLVGPVPTGQPPDISALSPAQAASRLYDRVMAAHERGRADSVQMFAPMAITAYQMIGNLDMDQRYDLGRIGAVSGDARLARAEADTMLAVYPTHLLGLILAGNAARMRKDTAAERTYHDRLLNTVAAERAKQLPEYVAHENDIAMAVDAKRP
jgi:hypothetical protein